MREPNVRVCSLIMIAAVVGMPAALLAQRPKKDAAWITPALPDGQTVATDTSQAFLKPTATLKAGVAIAKTAPTIDFLFYPGQTYPGKPWSNWGDSLAVDGKY